MKPFAPLALFLTVSMTQPAVAETVTVGFSPPVGQAMIYRIEQVRPMDGQECRFIAERELRFERDGDGYILHATLRRIIADAPAVASDPFSVALTPLLDVEQNFRVDAGGRIVALDDADGVWRAVEAGFAKMAVGFDPDTSKHRAAARVLALFQALSDEGRLALLAGELKPLLLFARAPLADGPGRGVETVAGTPFARPVPVNGSVVIAARMGDRLTVDEKLAGAGVTVDIRYQLSATTGLIGNQRRHLVMGAQWLTETRTLLPAQP
ncbi:MAG: hypothetical protein ABW048_04930 [Sphingobium sp.]